VKWRDPRAHEASHGGSYERGQGVLESSPARFRENRSATRGGSRSLKAHCRALVDSKIAKHRGRIVKTACSWSSQAWWTTV
jgi:hypothetical protein